VTKCFSEFNRLAYLAKDAKWLRTVDDSYVYRWSIYVVNLFTRRYECNLDRETPRIRYRYGLSLDTNVDIIDFANVMVGKRRYECNLDRKTPRMRYRYGLSSDADVNTVHMIDIVVVKHRYECS
jgi:hypothetical protein